jgi:hypothetical protein
MKISSTHAPSTLIPATSYLLRSSTWELFGNKDLASLYSQIPLDDDNDRPKDVTSLALCSLAHQAFEDGDYAKALTFLIEAKKYAVSVTSINNWSCILIYIML